MEEILKRRDKRAQKALSTGAQMLESIDHMTLKRLQGVETVRFCHNICDVFKSVITLHNQICKPLTSGLLILMNGVISLPDATSYDKNLFQVCKLYILSAHQLQFQNLIVFLFKILFNFSVFGFFHLE